MSLRELYQEMIIDHGKHPRNFGVLPAANHQHAGHNPLCGDKLMVYLIKNDGVIADIKFEGQGCAISVASASLMTDAVKGKSIEQFMMLYTIFHQMVTAGDAPSDQLGKLAVFAGVAEFPVRVKCASLCWHTLKAAIENNPKPTSTE